MNFHEVYKKYSKMTDKGTTHSYLGFYEEVLPRFVNKKAVLLELGVQSGGSLLLWEEYLVNATVHGIDVAGQPKSIEGHSSIVYHRMNCTDKVAVRKEFEGIGLDIVIDDASHRLDEQLASFELFYPMIREGGIYVIEDVVAGSIERFRKFKYPVIVYDLRKVRKQNDDILVLFHKHCDVPQFG